MRGAWLRAWAWLSGHTAAVPLCGCIAILLPGFRPAPGHRVVAFVLCCIPVAAGQSRLPGMRYLGDVPAGALTGGPWLLLVITALLRREGSWGMPIHAGRGGVT